MADQLMQHLLRRAGFGSTADELAYYGKFSFSGAVDALLNYDQVADDIEGARAIGMQAILLDRDVLHRDFEPRITGLAELLPQLGLQA